MTTASDKYLERRNARIVAGLDLRVPAEYESLTVRQIFELGTPLRGGAFVDVADVAEGLIALLQRAARANIAAAELAFELAREAREKLDQDVAAVRASRPRPAEPAAA